MRSFILALLLMPAYTLTYGQNLAYRVGIDFAVGEEEALYAFDNMPWWGWVISILIIILFCHRRILH